MTPETTDGREGFIHATDMTGGASEMTLKFILRDFERDGLAAKGALLQQVCAAVAATEPRAEITCTIRPQYRNMRYWLENDMTPVDLARAAAAQPGDRAGLGADPRRHRWLAPDRNGRALPQSVHRHAEHPRPAGMGLGAGYGAGHRVLPRLGATSGQNLTSGFICSQISHGGPGV